MQNEPVQNESTPQSRATKISPAGAKLTVVAVATGCAFALISLPRPVLPSGPPPLRLSRHAIQIVIRADQSLASRVPSDALAEQFRSHYFAQGQAEASSGETRAQFDARRRALTKAVKRLHEHDREAVMALRAEAVQHFEQLTGSNGHRRSERWLGSFSTVLERYNLSLRETSELRRFVVRTLFKARWNAIATLELTDTFEPVEEQAYWGWLALHGDNASPSQRRLDAAHAFRSSGGYGGLEAEGALAAALGRHAWAATRYHEAHTHTGNLRLRNHALACLALP